MKYKSKITVPSRTIPDASFTIRRLSEDRRTELRDAIAPHLHTIRLTEADMSRLADSENSDDKVELERLRDIVNAETSAIDRAWFDYGLVSVDGIEIDDEPATPATLVSDGPQDFYREIIAAIKKAATLSATEEGEFGPPSTSDALGDGRMNDSSVDSAETRDSI